MKAYSNGSPKIYPQKTEHVPGTSKGVSSTDKLVTRNANRSFKKAERRSAKKMIKKELQSLKKAQS